MPASLQIRSNWPERSSMRHADIRALARRWFPSPRGRDATAFVRTGCWLGPRDAISPTLTRAQLRTLHIPGTCGRQWLPRRMLSVKILPVLRSFFLQKSTAEARGLPPLISLCFHYFIFAGNSLQLFVRTNNDSQLKISLTPLTIASGLKSLRMISSGQLLSLETW